MVVSCRKFSSGLKTLNSAVPRCRLGDVERARPPGRAAQLAGRGQEDRGGRGAARQPAGRFVSRNGVAYGMRRGKCRGQRPDLDGDVRSEGLTGSIAGLFLERR